MIIAQLQLQNEQLSQHIQLLTEESQKLRERIEAACEWHHKSSAGKQEKEETQDWRTKGTSQTQPSFI